MGDERFYRKHTLMIRPGKSLPPDALDLLADQDCKLVSVQSDGAGGGWTLLLVKNDGKEKNVAAMTLPSVTKQRKHTVHRLRTPIVGVTRITQFGVFFLSGGMADPGGIHDGE